jgi:hypothetical protein
MNEAVKKTSIFRGDLIGEIITQMETTLAHGKSNGIRKK